MKVKLNNKQPLSDEHAKWFRDRANPATRTDKPPYHVPTMVEIKRTPPNGFKCVSTFSGCGGSSLGYKMAGFRVLWANEFIPAAQETYRANHPSTILDTRDIREVHPEEILQAIGMERGELDLFDGSPPCASFSTAGIREAGWGRVKKYSDTEQRTDDLFLEFARLIDGVQPKVFVAENVKGLTVGVAKEKLGSFQQDTGLGKAETDDADETFIEALSNCGYRVGYKVLNAAYLGVPQSRQRTIFVAVRMDISKEFGLAPVWPHPLPYVYTVRDAIPWIQALTHDTSGAWSKGPVEIDSEVSPAITVGVNSPNSQHFKVEGPPVESESDIAKYCTGVEWDKLKPGEQSEKYFSLVKADPETPCPTICASHGSGGIASVVHPFEKRKFSIAELKRICAFPDDFILTGSYAQQWERLGRAVPPVMMSHVAACVRRELLSKIPRDWKL